MTDEQFEQFLAMQQDASEKHQEAKTYLERIYWQGVKDGLRKCYATLANDPAWLAVGGNSPDREEIEEMTK